MAKYKGRDLLLYVENTPGGGVYSLIAGMRSTSMSINNSAVDVTDKEGSPWREILASAGLKTMSISASGVMNNAASVKMMRSSVIALDGTDMRKFRIVTGLGDKFEGNFLIAGFDSSGENAGEETYSIKLESSSAPVYTPAP